jgi:hypothetical protein
MREEDFRVATEGMFDGNGLRMQLSLFVYYKSAKLQTLVKVSRY